MCLILENIFIREAKVLYPMFTRIMRMEECRAGKILGPQQVKNKIKKPLNELWSCFDSWVTTSKFIKFM